MHPRFFIFPLYLQYLLIDFHQTFVTGASWDTDDLITFLGQKVKSSRSHIAAEAHSTRRYRRVQLFLVASCGRFYVFHCPGKNVFCHGKNNHEPAYPGSSGKWMLKRFQQCVLNSTSNTQVRKCCTSKVWFTMQTTTNNQPIYWVQTTKLCEIDTWIALFYFLTVSCITCNVTAFCGLNTACVQGWQKSWFFKSKKVRFFDLDKILWTFCQKNMVFLWFSVYIVL